MFAGTPVVSVPVLWRGQARTLKHLQGLIKPNECEAFGLECTPRRPLGATMVSGEGACAAYYHYRRLDVPPNPVPVTLSGVGGG